MFLAADLPSDRGIGDGPCGDNMQTLPFDVLDAPDPFPETINLVDDDEEGAPKGCDGQVQPTSVGKSLPPQHGGCAPQLEQAPSGKSLPLQHHGGCAQPEIPLQNNGQPEAPLPPQHGGGDGQPGQTPPGKSLPEQPKQASTEVRAAPSGHSYSLPEVCSNMGISSQAQPDFARSKGKVETYDVETLEDAEVQGFFQFFRIYFLVKRRGSQSPVPAGAIDYTSPAAWNRVTST